MSYEIPTGPVPDAMTGAVGASRSQVTAGGSAPLRWLLNESYLATGHTLYNNDRGLENTGPSDNLIAAVPTLDSHTFPNVDDHLYFEVHSGPGGDAEYQGYITFLDRRALAEINPVLSPTGFSHVSLRGTGALVWTGNNTVRADLAHGGDGTGTTIVQFVINPAQDRVYIGVGGTFVNATGQTYLARNSLANIVAQTPTFTRSSMSHRRLGFQTRGLGDLLSLATVEADFVAGLPTGATALGAAGVGDPWGTY